MRILQGKLVLAGTTTIFLGVLLLLTTISTAEEEQITVSNLEFFWNGEEITHISHNNPMPTNIRFDYEAPGITINSVRINAQDINYDASENYAYISMIASCEEDLGTCEVRTTSQRGIIIRHNKETFSIIITFDTDQGEITKEIEKTFELDNSNPTLEFLGTDKCHEGTCYIASGERNRINIRITDIGAGFSRGHITFSLGPGDGTPALVSRCDGGDCYGYVTVSCNNNQQIPLRIIDFQGLPSRNDAGIRISGLETKYVTCDSSPPEINEIIIENAAGLEILTLNNQVLVTANITEDVSPRVNMTIRGSNIGAQNVTATCNPTAQRNEFRCTGSIMPGEISPGQYDLPVEFTDLAGNTVTTTERINIFSATDETQADFWDVSRVTPSNPSLDKANLLFARDIYAEISLTPRRGAPNIVTAMHGRECVPVREGITGNNGDISNLRVIHADTENNNVYVKFTLAESGTQQRYAGMNRLEYRCPVTLTTRSGDTYYAAPETKNFTIMLNLRDQGGIHVNIQDEIDRIQEEVESKTQTLMNLRRASNTLTVTCQAFAAGETAMSTLGAALAAMELAAVGTGPFSFGTLEASATKFGHSTDAAHEGMQRGAKYFAQACKLFTCEPSYIGEFDSYLTDNVPLAQDITNLAGYDDPSAFMNPWRSEIVAYMTMCVPAVIHHREVRLGVECNYLQCLSQSTGSMGVSPSACQDQKQYAECTLAWSNVLDAFPITAMFRDVTGRLSEIMSDPVSLFGSTGVSFYCSALAPVIGGKGACHTIAGAQASLELTTMVGAMFSTQVSSTDYCTTVINRIDPRTKYWRELPGSPVMEPPVEEISLDSDTNEWLECQGTSCKYFDFRGRQSYTLNLDAQNPDRINIYNQEGKSAGYIDMTVEGDTTTVRSEKIEISEIDKRIITEKAASIVHNQVSAARERMIDEFRAAEPDSAILGLYDASVNENFYNDFREITAIDMEIAQLEAEIERREREGSPPERVSSGEYADPLPRLRVELEGAKQHKEILEERFRENHGDLDL